MKKKINLLFTGLLFVFLLTGSGFTGENEKLAQTGFQFLSVISDARAAAMAEAMTSLEFGSGALFFNPAGMANMKGFIDMTASTNQWIADISHNTFSLAVNPAMGHYGVIGFSVQSVDYGKFYGTRVDKSKDLGYVDTEIFELNSMAIGVGYAKSLTDRFSVGGQVRWVKQDLGESMIPFISAEQDTSLKGITNDLTPIAYDFGTQFKTGFKSLVFGMSVRNFSKEIKYVEEGFQLPLVFNLGISMNMMDFFENTLFNSSLFLAVDATHFRSHAEQVKVGLDYRLMDILSLRGGYVSNNDENSISYGMGVEYMGLALDYAYTPFGVFDNVKRMTVRFSL
ncbi:PorV/PorQ family protein [candidate division KSB1 bacterium]|nr:PorV/PorQ family protein [candidate division KSB1 bacterium]